MQLLAYLMLYSVVSAFPTNITKSTAVNDGAFYSGEISNPSEHQQVTSCETNLPQTTEEFLNMLLVFVKNVIENGQEELGIPPLEPLEFDNYILVIPAGLIFLNLKLKAISASGFSDFIIHDSKLDVKNLTFDIDMEFPSLHIISDDYDLLGFVYAVIPLYGKGTAEFHIEGFRLRAKLHLEQSEDGKSVLIKKIENNSFIIPYMKSTLTGVLGGGDVDAIVNVLIEEVVLNYINRFHGAIAMLTSQATVTAANTLLRQPHTWCYIDALQYNQK